MQYILTLNPKHLIILRNVLVITFAQKDIFENLTIYFTTLQYWPHMLNVIAQTKTSQNDIEFLGTNFFYTYLVISLFFKFLSPEGRSTLSV